MWQVKKVGPWKVPVTVIDGDKEAVTEVIIWEYYEIYDPVTLKSVYTKDGKEIKQFENFSDALHKCAELINMRRNKMDERVQHEVDKEEEYDPFEDTGDLTQKQANEYLQKGGVRCPYCHSENIESAGRDMWQGYVYYDMECDECNHQWSEGYQLFEIVDENGLIFEYVEEEIPFKPSDFLQIDDHTPPSPLSSNPDLDDIEEH